MPGRTLATNTCQMLKLRFRSGSRSITQTGSGSFGFSKMSSLTAVAFALKREKFVPSSFGVLPNGSEDP